MNQWTPCTALTIAASDASISFAHGQMEYDTYVRHLPGTFGHCLVLTEYQHGEGEVSDSVEVVFHAHITDMLRCKICGECAAVTFIDLAKHIHLCHQDESPSSPHD